MKKTLFLIVLTCLSIAICTAQNHIQPTHDSLRNEAIPIGEVVVTGTRVPVPSDVLPTPVSIVSRAKIEASGETALLPVLMQQVPGLFVTRHGVAGYGVSGGAAGGINMRGFSGGSGQVLMLIDGHPQYATIYGHPVADAYIASDAQRVEVSRGAASILYGASAMGGAINIITRQATGEGNRLNARLAAGSYGLQRYSVTDTYRRGKFSAVASANYEGTNGHRENMRFDEVTGALKLGYEMSQAWRVTGNVNVAKAKGEVPGPVTRPLFEGMTDVVRGMAGLSLENHYERTRGAVNFYYNWGDHKINDGYNEGGSSRPFLFRSTDWMGGVNIWQAVTPWRGGTITAGVDVKLYGGNAYRNPETEIYADHVKLHEVAGYLLAQQILGRFMLEAGARLENHKLYGTEWVPQAGLSYKPAEHTSLKFSFSKGFRSPNMRELYMYAPANAELRPERSRSWDFTVSQGLLEGRLQAELTLFYIEGDNMIEVIDVGEGRMQNRNVGEFANKGVEFALNYSILRNLAFNSNYSYLDMEKAITGVPQNKFYAGATWMPGKFTVSAGAQAIGKLYLVTGETPQTTNFTLLNARVAYRPLKWLEFFVNGENLLNEKYETIVGYPMPGAIFTGGVSLNF